MKSALDAMELGITAKEYEKLEGSELNKIKELLAFEVTKLIHGEEEAKKAQDAAKALFGGGNDISNMPGVIVADEDFEDDKVSVTKIMVKAGIAKSNGDAKKLIQQGGVTLDGEKVTDMFATIEKSSISNENPIILKKGKKVFVKILLK